MNKIVIIAAVAVLLLGCARSMREVKLTVVNGSASTITNVVAAGSGFSAPLGSFAPGVKGTANLRPSDDAGFKLDFDADGKHFSESAPKGTWSGMKEVILTITNNFSVSQQSVTTF